jgi:hypothetical protein
MYCAQTAIQRVCRRDEFETYLGANNVCCGNWIIGGWYGFYVSYIKWNREILGLTNIVIPFGDN